MPFGGPQSDRNRLGSTGELPPIGIDHVFSERELQSHVATSSGQASALRLPTLTLLPAALWLLYNTGQTNDGFRRVQHCRLRFSSRATNSVKLADIEELISLGMLALAASRLDALPDCTGYEN